MSKLKSLFGLALAVVLTAVAVPIAAASPLETAYVASTPVDTVRAVAPEALVAAAPTPTPPIRPATAPSDRTRPASGPVVIRPASFASDRGVAAPSFRRMDPGRA